MEKELIQLQELLEFHPKTSFTIICKGRVVSIGFDEITHVSKYRGETVIYTKGSNYRTYYSLQEILNDLPVNEFFRVHKSQVVALQFIEGYVGRNVIVNGQGIPMTNYYRLQLSKLLSGILNQRYKMTIHEPTRRPVIPGDAGGYGALPEKGSGTAM